MRAAILTAVMTMVAVTGSARAVPSTVVAPMGAAAGSASPMGVTGGGEVTFVNLDLEWHTVVAEEEGPRRNPWCDDRPEFADGCPLFFADLTPHSGGVSVIQGADALRSGRVYGFTCLVHPQIEGALFAL